MIYGQPITFGGGKTKVATSLTPVAGVTYTNGISDLSPTVLNEIAAAISDNANIMNTTSVVYYDSGDTHRKVSVGDQINFYLAGVSYAFRIVGFNHDALTDAAAYGKETATGTAGITFQMVNCVNNYYTIHASGAPGWDNCTMRTSTLPSMLLQLSETVQSVITAVNKKASAGNSSSTIKTVSDELFLLSEIEVFASVGNSFAGEGEPYAYYVAGNSKIKSISGTNNLWWLRSPAQSGGWCAVNADGTSYAGWVSREFGIAFAFCV